MKKSNLLLSVLIIILIVLGVSSNLYEQRSLDQSKIPEFIESNNDFQKWITNLKNKGLNEIEADDFRLQEESEIYNTKWTKVSTMDVPNIQGELKLRLEEHKDIDMVVYSPSEMLYVDFRPIEKDGYGPNEVNLYGQLDDKILDTMIIDCSTSANCYYDRGYFIDETTLVVSEVSRNIDKKAEGIAPCGPDVSCEYTFKLYYFDLKDNKKLMYVSSPFMATLDKLIPEL